MRAAPPLRLTEWIASEDQEHLSLARALTYAIGAPGKPSEHRVSWQSHEIRNAKSAIEGARRKARGVVAGEPDVTVRWGGRGYHIELKRVKGGVVSDAQLKMHENLRVMGDEVFVACGWVAAMKWLYGHGIPMRKVVLPP